MTQATVPSTNHAAAMLRVLGRLGSRLRELGLNVSVWDSAGALVGSCMAGNDLCRIALESSLHATEALSVAAGRALARREPVTAQTPCGCCLVAVPVLRRRRMVGAVAACYPTREALASGALAKAWRGMGLDEKDVRRQAQSVRHSRDQAADFAQILSWLVESEQATEIAGAETGMLSANLSSTYEELSLLYRISGFMKVNQPAGEFLRGVCSDLLEVMHISAAAAVLYPHPSANPEDVVVLEGDLALDESQLRALAREHVAARFVHNRPMLDNQFRASAGGPASPCVERLIAAPLVSDDNLMGMILGFNKDRGDFDSVDLKLIGSIANQSAVFVSNNRLYAELQELLMGVLHALTASIDTKDPYTSGHSGRVAILTRRIAEKMGLPAQKVQQLYLAGLLHDIGKIGVPESVLRKPGRLTEEEFWHIRCHPGTGARILGGLRHLEEVISGIYTHHERPDGLGYPQGLRGDQVPLEGRVVGLADAFDAMSSERTYRKALPLDAVVAEIRQRRGTQFDPAVVDVFLSMDLEQVLEELRQPASTVFPADVAPEVPR